MNGSTPQPVLNVPLQMGCFPAQRYFLENVKSALAEGEFYVDHEAGHLFVWPKPEWVSGDSRLEAVAPTGVSVMELHGTEFVTISNLTFRDSSYVSEGCWCGEAGEQSGRSLRRQGRLPPAKDFNIFKQVVVFAREDRERRMIGCLQVKVYPGFTRGFTLDTLESYRQEAIATRVKLFIIKLLINLIAEDEHQSTTLPNPGFERDALFFTHAIEIADEDDLEISEIE